VFPIDCLLVLCFFAFHISFVADIDFISCADIEYRIPLLRYFKCLGILLHGRLSDNVFWHLIIPYDIYVHCYIIVFQVCSWGGYTFIINLIPMHVLLCIVTGRYSSRLYIAYAPLVSTYNAH
jgi:hypothetical protein